MESKRLLLETFALFVQTSMLAARTIRNFISGHMEALATCSSTKLSESAWISACKRKHIPRKRVPSVDAAASHLCRDGCFTARAGSAVSPGTGMELGLTTFDKSIVGNLGSPT